MTCEVGRYWSLVQRREKLAALGQDRPVLAGSLNPLSFLAKRLLEAWRNLLLPDELLDPLPPAGQIRFNKNPPSPPPRQSACFHPADTPCA